MVAVGHDPRTLDRGLGVEPIASDFGTALRAGGRASRETTLRLAAERLSDDALVAMLRDPADDVLRNAAIEMLVLRAHRAVPLLIGLLSDRDADVVLHAVQTLGRIRDVRALGAVVTVLRHANPNVVQAALLTLGRLGHKAAVPLLTPFLGADLWLRAAAIEALGDLRHPDSVAPLGECLDDPMVGSFAADALARIGGLAACEQLAAHWLTVTGWSEPLLDLLALVLEGLDERPAPLAGLRAALVVALSHTVAGTRLAAARCLLVLGSGEGDDEALAVLLRESADQADLPVCLLRRSDLVATLLADEGHGAVWGLRLAALHPTSVPVRLMERVMDAVRPSQLPALAEALHAMAEPRLAAAVARLYGRLSPDARRSLVPVVRTVRAALAEVLPRIPDISGDARAVLAAVVNLDGAAETLSRLPDAARIEALRHVTDQPAVLACLPWIAWLEANPVAYAPIAAQCAERTDLRLALPQLRRLLAARPQADLVRLLGTLRDPDGVPVLETIIEGPDTTLVPGAITALGAIGGDRARVVLRTLIATAGAWERFAWRALAECRDDTDLDRFRQGLQHDDWHVRMVAVTVLSVARRPEDQAALAGACADPVRAVADRARAFGAR